jgi:hypothetical protein
MDAYAPPRLRSSTIRGGSSGLAARPCQIANTTSSTTPAARKPQVDGVCQLCVAALENP